MSEASSSSSYVRARGADFLILDELEYYKVVYQSTSICPNEDLYALRSAFRMRSQINAEKNAELTGRIRRKRKRNAKLDVDPDFKQLCTNIEKRFQQIILANEKVFENRNGNCSSEEDDSNEIARLAVSTAECSSLSSTFLSECSSKDGTSMGDYHLTADNCIIEKQPDECVMWRNEGDTCLVMQCSQHSYIVPSSSAFVVGDVSLSRHLIARGMQFNLIVIDPPWINKSVKRKKSYAMFDERDLFDIRIPELLREDGIVAVWVTNNDTMKQCVDDAIAAFGLVRLASCHWLKVTTRGEPICAFQPHHKVPFETCVLACRKPFVDNYSSKIGNDFLLISTPSAIHSRKPPIKAVLEAIDLIEDCSCLELYGRYLLPHTTTIGFEAIKLQNSTYFKPFSNADSK